MAINEIESNRAGTAPAVGVAGEDGARRPVMPAIRWGAVLAGVAVGISVQLALTLLGIATGLSTTSASRGESLGLGPVVWAGISMLVSAFVGGYVAARMSGLKRKADGVLHGAVSWAVTTILFAVLATTIGGSLVAGVFNNMTQLAQPSSGSGASPLAALITTTGGRMDAPTLREVHQYLQAGQRDQAVTLVAAALAVPAEQAASLIDQAIILSGAPGAASGQGRAAPEKALNSAGNAAWAVFLPVALALALGIVGGALGAAGSRRVSWSGKNAGPR